jgi:hypothetical protein
MLDKIFGSTFNNYHAEPRRVKEEGAHAYSIKFITEKRGKTYSVTGVIRSEHAKERAKLVYEKLEKLINKRKHVSPIDLERALKKALHHKSDLLKHKITIETR